MPNVRLPRTLSLLGYAIALMIGAGLLSPAQAQAFLRGSLTEDQPVASVAEPAYRVKPVDGAPVGPGIRRVLERFLSWTSICDEAKGRRVCNIVQSIAASDGRLAFSWSIAATASGEPVFLVRAPVTDFPAHTVTLDFGGRETVLRLTSCDASLCVGFLPVDSMMIRHIRDRGTVKIHYWTADNLPKVEMTSSLDGLARALISLHGTSARAKS